MKRILRTPLGLSAAVLLLAVLVLAVIAPLVWTDQANAVDTAQISRGSTAEHWMGTDNLGRDVFLRVLVATGLSVRLALLATAIGVLAGLVLGAVPVVLGRRAGRVVTAVVNIAVAFPALLLALFFAVVIGPGTTGSLLAIGFATAPGFARLVQTLVAKVAGLDYVAAARVAGAGRIRLLVRHILPNVAEPLVINATMAAGAALLAFAGLSFLGLGVQPPEYDWGRLLGEGLQGIYLRPAAAIAPGVAVVVAGLAFHLFGEALSKGFTRHTAPVKLRRTEAASAVPTDDDAVLVVEDLRVAFPGVTPVRGVSFTVGQGEAVGIVGESGSGKSLTALAVARLIEHPGQVDAQRLTFQGRDLRNGDDRVHRRLLGTSLAMVFQDPMTSLNPAMRIGRQLAEVAEQHQGASRKQAWQRAVDRLRAVRIPDPERRARQYPHEFSGGMRQRAMIGMGLMGKPALIIADEPTTALDVTVQRQVLRLLRTIRAADGAALLLISHDITVVSQVCDRVLVMYAGRVVEDLPADELHTAARHPYTRALLAAVPDMTTDRDLPLAVIPGRPVDAAQVPTGCAYAPRCPLATERCVTAHPPLETDNGRRVACWHADVPVQVGDRGE
ncbi:dipeptide/oligopeptide/nickel ABC transporter permease/ATP-binding protein [Kibdelosporangium persicum]|uniref:Oligopeptide transport ATP-binding protein OppD n=1 Tax=Kibdelosporangium persicum TaxID=2698649 RepID=A0ABX2F7V1_9PSEU|nr:dipeptide/oligopeptide/nickel ABC transporter permease/ATP-binding protein [Kibdelosporangium persicum]NRN67278.1 Oligopeptide transport ATP-binding protein OppD [Kibdelosporangium persicum]